jgi:hypothetical protein
MDTRNLRKVAVLAVHGVGEHKPFETARAVGDLLQDLDQQRSPLTDTPPPDTPPCAVTPSYDPFIERELRINVRPVVVSPTRCENGRGIRGPFHELVSRRIKQNPSGVADADDSVDDELAYDFMRGQLRHYHGEEPADTYHTLRLEGRRRPDDADAQTERAVHVYELFWSDLSNLTGGVLRIVGELYQLLFHLPSLGTHAVDAEAVHHRGAAWRAFRRAQSWSAIVLTAPIPLLNLFMLAAAAVVAALLFFEQMALGRQLVTVVAVAAAVLAGGIGTLFWKWGRPHWAVWLAPVGLALAAVVMASVKATTLRANVGPWLWPFEASVIAAPIVVCIALVLAAYDKRRPGVSHWAIAIAALVAVFLLLTHSTPTAPPFERAPDPYVFVRVGIRIFEVLYIALLTTWGGFYVLSVAALVAGAFAVRHRAANDPARRCRLTANVTLSISAFMFSTITIAVWGAIAMALRTPIAGLHVLYTPFFRLIDGNGSVESVIDATLRQTALVLPILAIVGGVSALPAIWGLVPVVWSEISPPDRFRTRVQQYATRLGEWLDLTFKGLLASAVVLYAAIMFLVPAAVYLAMRNLSPGPTRTAVQTFGMLSGAAFAWVLAAGPQAKKLTLGFRPVLDTMLDVDNWFREHPLDRNPRARICGRYVSLLRYICNWTDPIDGKPYDAIVIVAHSQGTVITADLLRFIGNESRTWPGSDAYDPELQRLGTMSVFLFTMGSPLRALYGRRFPRLYKWAHHDGGPTPRRPAAADLGVAKWINAYRSGDYIGRYLWRDSRDALAWTVSSTFANGATTEDYCIGAGAHTHYWDETAPAIARQLDELIGDV